MEKKHLRGIMKFSRLISIGFLSLILTVFGIETTQAQRSTLPGTKDESTFVSLLSKLKECRTNGSVYWSGTNRNISIGRRLYPSIASMSFRSSSYTLTCKINPKGTAKPFGTFRFTFGVDEYDIGQFEVKVYLDGKITAGHTVNPGEIKTLLLDVSNSEDIAIEFKNTNTTTGIYKLLDDINLYIFDDILERLE
ncbi:MAG: hypothetical protein F6K22_04910 [Okeania sp. SIO2F4]|uniref:hypothetical protein n=1 Tax=Okeania sp. SIO2F4 TaxID=2607790 RepID=UPI00142AEADA|nr:hypothetical protein [Okeania sp. SIO2F4]NES02232.1 hypothetical protein [Okeania sp. SIO2F4]